MELKASGQYWLECRDVDEWHEWLLRNHSGTSEVWLKIRKAGSTCEGVLLKDAVTEAIAFGWIDGKMHSLDEDGYLLRFTPRRTGSIWSMANRKRAEALIEEGRMSEAGMEAVRKARENGRWQSAYTSREEPPMPADLEEALRSDGEAVINFKKWSNSDKLQVVVWIEGSKRPETRKSRIMRVVCCARDKREISDIQLNRKGWTRMGFYDFKAVRIDGTEAVMEEYRGKVVLVVNTASNCGFTPQFKELEELYQEYRDRGFEILGFPCNQFANQDPGTNEEIYNFCQINYGVSFTMFEKIDVNGDGAHPLFKYLKKEAGGILGNEIKWNFTKFLIDADGKVVKRYASTVAPMSIKGDIDKLL